MDYVVVIYYQDAETCFVTSFNSEEDVQDFDIAIKANDPNIIYTEYSQI